MTPGPPPARPVFPASQLRERMSEEALQQWVIHLARLHGWRYYHTRYSKRSPSGFPDLVLVRRGQLIFAELKSQKGHLTAEQRGWQADLAHVAVGLLLVAPDAVREYLWRPSDMEQIAEVLE